MKDFGAVNLSTQRKRVRPKAQSVADAAAVLPDRFGLIASARCQVESVERWRADPTPAGGESHKPASVTGRQIDLQLETTTRLTDKSRSVFHHSSMTR